MKRIVRPVVVLALATGAGYCIWLQHRTAPLVLTGIVTTHDVIVSSLIGGRVEKLAVSEGDTVKKHQIVAVIATANGELDASHGYAEVRAPIDGVVDVRAVREGEVVSPGRAVVTLVNPDDLWVRADVEESYVGRLRIGDLLTMRLSSGAERTGTLFYRSVVGGFATQRDVSRTKRDIKTFEVRLRVDNTDRQLAVGMTVYVRMPPL